MGGSIEGVGRASGDNSRMRRIGPIAVIVAAAAIVLLDDGPVESDRTAESPGLVRSVAEGTADPAARAILSLLAPLSALHEEADGPPCALSIPASTLAMTLKGCTTVASDTASSDDPTAFWGTIDCEEDSRHSQETAGGDTARSAEGAGQGDSAFRRLTVIDGDDVYGERCELGLNNHRVSPVAIFGEGGRWATYASIRLPDSFPLGVDAYQNVLQMKQAQPADNGGGTPALSLKAFDDRWILFHSGPGPTSVDRPLWEVPAERGRWTRFALDVTYSQHTDLGSVRVYVDLDGDGDFGGDSERSPRFHTNTLKRETEGTSADGYEPGDSLESHLRAGIYHDPAIDCPAPTGCQVEIDNVQVLAP